MPVYRIKDWNVHFENNKSRVIDRCSSVFQPNKQHGLGFRRIMSEADGMAIYGMWTCIVQMCSQQRAPRAGWLTEDGKPNGPAISAQDVAMKLARPLAEVERCLEMVCSARVGWMVLTDGPLEHGPVTDGKIDGGPKSAAEVPSRCPQGAPEATDGGQVEGSAGAPRCKEGMKEGMKEGTTHTHSPGADAALFKAPGGDPDPESEPAVPTLAEVLTFCAGPAGIAEKYGRRFFDKKAEAPAMWFDPRGNLIEWKRQLMNRWVEDRHRFDVTGEEIKRVAEGSVKNAREERRAAEIPETVEAPTR